MSRLELRYCRGRWEGCSITWQAKRIQGRTNAPGYCPNCRLLKNKYRLRAKRDALDASRILRAKRLPEPYRSMVKG